MKKAKESFDRSDKEELLKEFDKKRRDFLKKLLISAAYVTPAILTLSMRDLEAKKKTLRLLIAVISIK